ncbi:MAG: DUF104 domain-containing protein [Planctomycetota bacterium]|nr:MAG: DUF104 domain-containing protein [Planctomycetota bacterium]REJ93600.1 MAG: DUF104 domain-containing protein [Planctomycetota bacterium]REK19940.1 MAG: DUF104 domain-containing protein [Planctomycetota bacterium]REK27505.1 MAG: DUF104 domain-containing protein [Planctomycetota bacterium]
MNPRIIDAIYDDGVLKPVGGGDLPLQPGQKVRIVIDAPVEATLPQTLQLAGEVYDGLSQDEIDEVEAIAFDRTRFFAGRATP